ncbi:IgGFc-binding protein, partial [Buceros rhinoceros silvestris]
ENCKVADNQPTDVQKTAATCRATGNGHHQTFDGRTFHFTGACTYTLTKSCHTDPALPIFSVEATNDQRGNLQGVRSVTVRVYDITVGAVRDEKGVVRVNHHRSHLPLALAQGKLLLQQRGKSLLVQASFGLKVLYDWDRHVLVKLPAKLACQVCGVCGN